MKDVLDLGIAEVDLLGVGLSERLQTAHLDTLALQSLDVAARHRQEVPVIRLYVQGNGTAAVRVSLSRYTVDRTRTF